MIRATSTDYAPWNLVRADNKKRARRNCISHLLSQIPYMELPQSKVDFGKRGTKGSYGDEAFIAQFGQIPEKILSMGAGLYFPKSVSAGFRGRVNRALGLSMIYHGARRIHRGGRLCQDGAMWQPPPYL